MSIGTLPIYTGAARTGTAITISLMNLQGSGLPNTSNQVTGLSQVYFTGLITSPIPVTVGQQSASLTGAGASGSLTWQRITINAVAGGTYAWVQVRGTGISPSLLGGCASGPTIAGTITARTCGPGTTAVFAFTINGSLDASQLDNLYIHAYGSGGSNNCYSNPASVPFFGRACDMLSNPLQPMPPIPEPATIILLGTGLLGVGGTALRRRSGSPPPPVAH